MSAYNYIDIPWLRPSESEPRPPHTPPPTMAPPPTPITTPLIPAVSPATPIRAPEPPHHTQTPVTPKEEREICDDHTGFRLRPHSHATMEWRMSIRPHKLFNMGLNHSVLLSMRWDMTDKQEVRAWRDEMRAEGRAEDLTAIAESVESAADFMSDAMAQAAEEREIAEAERISLAEWKRAQEVEKEGSRKRQRSSCEAGPSGEKK